MSTSAQPARLAAQHRKRAVYGALVVIALAATFASLLVNLRAPEHDRVAIAVGAVALLLFTLLGVALVRRLVSLEVVEESVYWVAAVLLVGNLVVRVYLLVPDVGSDLAIVTAVLWIPVLLLYSAMAFEPRPALRRSGAVVVATVVVTLPHALGVGSTDVVDYEVGFWLQVYFVYAVQVVALRFFSGLQQRADALEDEARALERLATTDALTGLPNRRLGQERLDAELRRAERYGRTFSVLMLDIDHFKQLNDRFGHPAGDVVLADLARYVGTMLRASDTLTRWGGEEFVVVAPETPAQDAQRLAELLRVSIERTTLGGGYGITVSVGVATFRPGDAVAQLVERADAALYRAKRAGRNRVAVELDPTQKP